ncbi:MAG: efflux RND transporter permease subunit [Pseudomonadales bacterium]
MSDLENPSLDEIDTHKGIIAWFARNSVAANLLMLIIIVSGLYSISNSLRSTMMPEINIQSIVVSVPFPGSTPEDVEEGIVLKIEQAVEDVEGITEITSTANSGMGTVNLEVDTDHDVYVVMDEVKVAVDGITTFPDQTESPNVARMEMDFAKLALQIQVGGTMDEMGRRDVAESLRRELLQLPEIIQVELFGDRPYEITIEVSELTLRKYGLTLSNVSDAIRRASVDLPGGKIRTVNGDVVLRTKDKAYRQYEFEDIVLITNPDGTRVTIGDVATVKDGFEELDGFSYFNGGPSIGVVVMAVGDQDILEVTDATKAFLAERQLTLPEGVSIEYWADFTYYLKDRLGLMFENMLLGAVLVFIILLLFMDFKVAMWVVIGLIVTFLGVFAALPLGAIDVTLNMFSVLGFIVVLGIVVDDAIVIGESAHASMSRDGYTVESVISGARRVATPATFGVLTTIAAFVPMVSLEGDVAAFPAAVGWVVILSLCFSLIESKLILPAHLTHIKSPAKTTSLLGKLQAKCNSLLHTVITEHYQPLLRWCLEFRYVTFAGFVALLIVTLGLVFGGVARYVMFPEVPGEFIEINLEMSEGVPKRELYGAIERIISAADSMQEDLKSQNGIEEDFIENLFGYGENSSSASFMLELTKDKNIPIRAPQVSESWRQHIGEIPGAKSLRILDADPMAGAPIAFLLISTDINELGRAADELALHLRTFSGVFDIDNNAAEYSDELNITMKPEGESLGLSLIDIGSQVRAAFYGEEAQRIQRGRHEVKVMVRYPEEQRQSITTLENMFVKTPQGDEVPFSSVANANIQPGYTTIRRVDGSRAVTVSANADLNAVEPAKIVEDIQTNFVPQLRERYPNLSIELDGGSEEEKALLLNLVIGLGFSLFAIYALLAIPLKSYLQPIIIMGVIPFGFIGAVFGHMLLGLTISNFSLFGILALAGVVVNDSIILVDFINQARARGIDTITSVIQAGTLRYRAIMLTSLTTFFGLIPIVLEQGAQAQFIIPMAVSLAFGIVFSTVVTLILIPCLYLVLEDLNSFSLESDPANLETVS